MSNHYDVIIAGARCAGAGLATFLAREGARVLVVDADPLPSDMVMSTHALQPPGVRILDELGVLDRVLETTPAARVTRIQVEDATVDIRQEGRDAPVAPRRLLIDTLLQEAATSAGAELRERTRVTGLTWDAGRVSGVRVRRRGRDGEAEETITAGLVVGADGRHSTVARLAGAYEYGEYTSPRPGYWAYWPRPAWFGTEAGHDFDLYMGLRGDRIRYIFRADSNLVLLATTAPEAVFERWRSGDHRAAYLEDIRRDPLMAPLTEGAEPVSPVRGAFREWYGFRQAAGAGWALVGDAGSAKDYTLGHGMSDALLHAKMLARAILDGGDGALERFWWERDVHSLSLFRFSEDWGRGDAVTELERVMYRHIGRSPELTARIAAVNRREVDPYQAFPVAKMAMWTLAAALRGKPGVLKQFKALGDRANAVAREVEDRRRLLAAVTAGAPEAAVTEVHEPERVPA